MKCTPHWTMISASTLVASRASCRLVADDIGDAVEDVRRLVVVGEDDGAALLLQPVDGVHIGRIDRPFEGRDELLDPLVEMRGLAGDLRREGQVRPFDDAEALGGGL